MGSSRPRRARANYRIRTIKRHDPPDAGYAPILLHDDCGDMRNSSLCGGQCVGDVQARLILEQLDAETRCVEADWSIARDDLSLIEEQLGVELPAGTGWAFPEFRRGNSGDTICKLPSRAFRLGRVAAVNQYRVPGIPNWGKQWRLVEICCETCTN